MEGMLGCDAEKYKIATTTSTNYTDTNLLNNHMYYYAVLAIGSNNACFSPLSNCALAKPISSCPPDGVVKNLIISKIQDTLQLNWFYDNGCCLSGFAIYRGSLPFTSYNHLPLDCAVSSTYYQTPIGSDSYYFLVVAYSNGEESCYGKDSNGNERPQSTLACYPQDISECSANTYRLKVERRE